MAGKKKVISNSEMRRQNLLDEAEKNNIEYIDKDEQDKLDLKKHLTDTNAKIFYVVAIVWILLCLAIRLAVDGGSYAVGQNFAGPFMGTFVLTLVHNTGAAWGLFSNSTFLLACFSVVLCLLVFCVVIVMGFVSNRFSLIGAAILFGGGLSNALERFFLGYVVDYINPIFIDFPVFNLADIGVVCGVIIFLAGWAYAVIKTWNEKRKGDKASKAEKGK